MTNLVALVTVVTLAIGTITLNKLSTPNLVDSVQLDNPTAKPTPAPTTTANTVGKKTVLRLTPNASRVVYLDTQVVPFSASSVINQLKKLDTSKEPIYLMINSPGGSVFDGMQIITQMEGMQAPVYTVCTLLCASMAAFIHQYGVKRYVLDRSFLMFHPGSGGIQGQIPNMLSMLGSVQNTVDKMNNYIVSRSKLTAEEFQRRLSYEMWIDGEDSVKSGLADSLAVILDVPNEDSSVMGFDRTSNERVIKVY